MLKFVTVLALVAAASAAPQTYDLPGGQAKLGHIVGHPWFPESGNTHVVGIYRPAPNSALTGASLKPTPSATSSSAVSLYPTGIHPGSVNIFQHASNSGNGILVQDETGNYHVVPIGNFATSFPIQNWVRH